MINFSKSDVTILIVDDISENILLISSILELEDYKVVIANNGFDALKIARTQFPDLILLDIMMPEMDGYEVCTALKENEKTAAIPVIFLTAKMEQEDQILGLQKGAIDYITKPYNTQVLLQKVETQVKLKKSIDIIKTQHEHLEKINATKDKFYSGIAKYINIPLEQIFKKSEKALLSDDINQMKKYLGDIRNATSESSNLLYSIIEWLRVQSGEILTEEERFDINEVIDQKITDNKRDAFAKNILLYKSSLPDMMVNADRSIVEKIFDCLLPNMIAIAENGAEIMISTREVAYSNPQKSAIKGAARYIKIKISILGEECIVKIPDKAFSIKYLLNNIGDSEETNQQFRFILSKSYVEESKGSIWLDAVSEKEFNFHFTLPRLT